MTGVNYNNMATLRSATCRCYAQDVAKLFVLREYPSPVDFEDKTNWTTIIVNNLKTEEDIATQRLPLDDRIHAELINMGNKAGKDSAESLVSEIVSTGKATGYRASEHSQKTQDKVDYHQYPSGKEIMKSLNGNDVIFADSKGILFQVKKKSDINRVHSVVLTWKHQKNRRNGEKTRLIANHEHPDVCPVINLAKMMWRKYRFKHSNKLPLTVYKNKDGEIKYMTHQRVTEIIRKAVKKVYPNITKEELAKYSCHSIRVWACVCLDEAGKSPDFIKKRLRWMGESYRVYLRDTNKINHQHKDALKSSLQTTMALIETVEDVSLEQLSPEDAVQAGEYDDGD